LPPATFEPLPGVPHRAPSLRPDSTLNATRVTTTTIPQKKTPFLPVLLGLGTLAIFGLVAATIALAVWRRSPTPVQRTPTDPSRYDPTRFDPSAYLPVANRMAREHYSDARLIGFAAMNVASDGTTQLAPDRVTSYLYRSASHSPVPGDASSFIVGGCIVSVAVNDTKSFATRSNGNCATPFLLEPRCTLRQVMKRAALPEGGRAVVTLTGLDGKNVWFVSLKGQTPVQIADDC